MKSASSRDGVPAGDEALQLAYACDLISESCMALRLTQPVRASAQLLLHRFYRRVSLRKHGTVWAAGGCILIASKLHDCSRTVRHIANVLHDRVWSRTRQDPLDFYGAQGYDWKRLLIATERLVLTELGFRVTAELPHKFVLIFVNTLRDKARAAAWTDDDVQPFRVLMQSAWNYANDALRVAVCVMEEPEHVAVACIALAGGRCAYALPEGWEMVFGCSQETCERISERIREGYDVGSTKGKFVDLSRSEVFKEFWPADREESLEQADGGTKRAHADGEEMCRKKKKSRFNSQVRN